jgi:hypothetical protein
MARKHFHSSVWRPHFPPQDGHRLPIPPAQRPRVFKDFSCLDKLKPNDAKDQTAPQREPNNH